MKAYARLVLAVCLVVMGSGCGDDSSSSGSDAGAEAGSGANEHDAGPGHDAGAGKDAAVSGDDAGDDDGGSSVVDGKQTCMLLCEDRKNRNVGDPNTCFGACLAEWSLLPLDCQMAALDYGKCATTAECVPIAECCYSEVGRYADLCPLSFQE